MCQENSYIGQFAASPLLMNSADGSCGCSGSNFIGSSKNKRGNAGFDRVQMNFNGYKASNAIGIEPISYQQQAGVSVDTGSGDAASVAPAETTTKKGFMEWLPDIISIGKQVAGLPQGTVEAPSDAYSTDINGAQDKDTSIVWWVVGGVVALIVIFVFVRALKKK